MKIKTHYHLSLLFKTKEDVKLKKVLKVSPTRKKFASFFLDFGLKD